MLQEVCGNTKIIIDALSHLVVISTLLCIIVIVVITDNRFYPK